MPYSGIEAIPQRHLVLSNGPELINERYLPAGQDHVNLYWGKIPFPKKELRLRLYCWHMLDPQAALNEAEIRFCMGVTVPGVRIVRRDASYGSATPGPWQYIEPGRELALAHLGRKWQSSWPAGKSTTVPDTSQSGDVAELGVAIRKEPVLAQYGTLVAELDLEAESAQPVRELVVRTVLRKPGGALGRCDEESCCDSGAGERGWWPKADIWVESDRNAPLDLTKGSVAFNLCERGGADWAAFNNWTSDHRASHTNNSADRFGTKNSGLWGVNVLYRVYCQGTAALGFAGSLPGAPSGIVFAGPYKPSDRPWRGYFAGRLRPAATGFLNNRRPNDYDYWSLGAGESAGPSEFFVAFDGASMLPNALLLEPARP